MRSIYDIVIKDKETKDSPSLSSYLFTEDEKVDFISTNVITLNLLFSGRVQGGIPVGRISMISAPSMLGKSFIAYGLVKNAQRKGMQVCIIDTERAFNFQFAKTIGIDISEEKLVVLQDNGIEEVAGIITTICKEIPKDERKNIFFVIDSWGALVTSKTLENAYEGNDKADMTIPKKKNNLANIILNQKATFFIVNHVYDNTGGMGDIIQIPGGRKIIFNSDSVVLGRSRAKVTRTITDKTVVGHIITAETFKSRFSKEKSKLQYKIKYDGGLDIFFGILEDALEAGVLEIPKQGYYSRKCVPEDVPVKEDKIYNAEYWLPVFKNTDFTAWLETKYTFQNTLDISNQTDILEQLVSEVSIPVEEKQTKSKKSK